MAYYTKDKFNITHIVIALMVLATVLGMMYLHTSTVNKMNKDNIEFERYRDSLEIEKRKLDQMSLLHDKIKLQKHSEKISGITIPDSFPHKELLLIHSEAKKYNLDVGMILRLIKAESSFRAKARSHVGAQGYMQLMPGTFNAFANRLNLKKRNNTANIKVGIYYLNHLYSMFKGYSKKERMRLTILAYNYGPGRVKRNIKRFLGPTFDKYSYLNKILRT